MVVSLQSHFATSCDNFTAYRSRFALIWKTQNNILFQRSCINSCTSLKGHSQLGTALTCKVAFSSLKRVYLNPKSNVCVEYIQKSASNLPSVSFDALSFTESANIYSSYYITLSYFVKNSIQQAISQFPRASVSKRGWVLSI